MPTVSVKQAKPAGPLHGMLSWRPENKHGFIRTDDDEWYYTDSRYVIDMTQVRTGARVYFVPRPANREGKHPVAAATAFEGQELTGWVVRINQEKPFCFVEAFDDENNKIEFFHYLGDNPLGLKEDDEIRFVAAETPRGVQATQVSKANQDKQAA